MQCIIFFSETCPWTLRIRKLNNKYSLFLHGNSHNWKSKYSSGPSLLASFQKIWTLDVDYLLYLWFTDILIEVLVEMQAGSYYKNVLDIKESAKISLNYSCHVWSVSS